jgi:hypothetical protein
MRIHSTSSFGNSKLYSHASIAPLGYQEWTTINALGNWFQNSD